MKNRLFLLALLFSGTLFATPGIHEALKNSSSVTSLKLSGEKDEAALLVKHHAAFSSLKLVVISGISDSIMAEQDIAAVAACDKVTQLKFENCGFAYLSGAVKMLISVRDVEISGCKKLDAENTFSTLAGMPSLKTISYSTEKLDQLPSSFVRLRGLEKISFHNEDISLADGYALNTKGRASLLADETLQLGFGKASLVLEYSCYDKNSAKEHIGIMRDMLQGVAGMSGGARLPKRNAAFTRENPLVKPPIAGLDVWKNVYSTNATTGGLVEYPSGTKIMIPSHAFVDANGNEVKGDVTIDYREFRDPVDILVSGIPMEYDSAGQKGNFESAGMFEINASVNGQEVFLAPGKKVDMQFAVVDTASSYNFYRLDSKNGWECLGKPGAVVNKEEQFIEDVKAVEQYNNLLNYRRVDRNTSLYDSLSLAECFENPNYIYTTKKTNSQLAGKINPKRYSTISFRKTFNGKDFTVFNISFVRKRFPEMNAFSSTNWMINGKVSAGKIRKMYGPKRGLNDMRIVYDGGSDFTLEVKDLNGIENISVTPVRIMNNKPVAYGEKECKWRYRSYSHQLKSREKVKAREIKRERKEYLKAIARFLNHKVDSMGAWHSVQPNMTSSERELSFTQWNEFVAGKLKSLKNEVSAEAANSNAMLRSLSLDGFGIYNCDQIQRLDSPVEVFAACMNGEGKDVKVSTIYIIDNHTNGVLTYSQPAFGESMNTRHSNDIDIAFSPQYQTSMMALGNAGEMYVAGPDEFKGKTFVSGQKYTFKVVAPGQYQTIGDLRKMLFSAE